MLTITIADILSDTAPDVSHYSLYMVRDGDVALYVGKSTRDVTDRILAHLGRGTWGWAQSPSLLGRLVLDNLPESRDWRIDLMTAAECEPLVKDVWPYLENFELRWDGDPGLAEIALIQYHRPCLNDHHNVDPRPLPEKYRDHFEDTHKYMQ